MSTFEWRDVFIAACGYIILWPRKKQNLAVISFGQLTQGLSFFYLKPSR